MIITKLDGQLGNQMFTYAAGYALSRDNEEPLSVFRFEYDTVAADIGFQLGCLKLDKCNYFCGIPLSLYLHTIKHTLNRFSNRLLHKNIFNVTSYCNENVDILREPTLEYHKMNLDPSKQCHLMIGFRQSPLYFDKYREDIVRQFTPNYKQADSVFKWIKEIENANYSVSLHIRRGDYVKAGLCISLDYYYEAVNRVLEEHSDARFFVFSDNIPWVKENLKIDWSKAVCVEHPTRIRPFDDIWLMSKCKSNIIANSSFSWWGAYLNSNDDKEVFAPIQILKNNKDIMCPGWTIIDRQ